MMRTMRHASAAGKAQALSSLLSFLFLFSACNSGTGEDPVEVPGSPTTVVAIPGNGQATIYWVPSETGFTLELSYTVTAVQQPARTCTVTPLGTEYYCVITGLSNGTAYTFKVIASSSAGSSAPSIPSVPVTPLLSLMSIPDSPEGVAAIAGNGQARVTWASNTGSGGSVITGFQVTTVQSPTKTCNPQTVHDTTCVVTGLTNGSSYTFTVTATNSIGTSVPSAPTAPVTPGVMGPSAPLNVWAAGGAGQATVSWTPPLPNGPPVLGYKAQVVGDAARQCTGGDMATSCVITGLANGTAYAFTVTAHNSVGAGTPSAPTAPVTPTNTPGVNWSLVVPGNVSPALIENLYKIRWAGNQFIAVGGGYNYGTQADYGIVMTSADGLTWTRRASGATDNLYDVTWTGSQFVAVGGGVYTGGSSSFPIVVTSPDGVTWTTRTSNSTARLSSVVWTGSPLNLLVAGGYNGNIVTSPDGVTWTKRTTNSTGNFMAFATIGSQVVALGWNQDGQSTALHSSTDGSTWMQRLLVRTAVWEMASTGTQVLVGRGDTTVTSPDGINWTKHATTGNALSTMIWDGTRFAAFGWAETSLPFMTSTNGLDWNVIGGAHKASEFDPAPTSFAWNGSRYVAVGYDGAIWASP